MNQIYPQKVKYFTGSHCRLISCCNKKSSSKINSPSDTFQKYSVFFRHGRIV